MRFVSAIVAFVLAAVMLVFGIAQRTIFLEPVSEPLSTTVEGVQYAVLTPGALGAHEGGQTVEISGSDTVFMAYGRTADVEAWIGDSSYSKISYSSDKGDFTSKTVTGDSASGEAAQPADTPTIVDPAGSDLWLEEFSAEKSLSKTINVPDDISVIIASDGTAPAPANVSVSWPVDTSTPWAGPLIVGGAVLLLIGLALYAWALLHMRRSRGPRRNLPRGPRMPKLPRAPRPKVIKASEITGGRKAISKRMATLVPVVVISGLVLSGCSADFWPQADDSSPASTSTATSDTSNEKDSTLGTPTPDPAAIQVEPVVTVPQLERIVGKISELTAEADATLNSDAIKTRFTGPALEQRLANYKIRASYAEQPALQALPSGPLNLVLPQQSAAWPRVVMAMILNEEDATVPPTALVLKQESPRANYVIEYAVQLEASAKVTDVAPAVIGAPIVAPDSKLPLLAPDQVAAAYADILMNGEASQSYGLFESDGDTLRTEIGVDKMNEWRAALPSTASIEFARAAGTGRPIALGTNDAGALVAVSMTETETVKPVDSGATVSPEKASKALSGVEATAKGIQSVYEDQLLFLVPAAGSTDQIVLLGMSRGLISSAELQ
ncbi:hypothetical protein [Leifsonia sp. A12D58]|uniref:hypothetical protein n=1 Tax=Leifsonia sp. A12D58 TaxID=3397674 RepID=UPI0039E0538B